MIPTLDPVVLLQRARRRYFVRSIVSILCIAVLLGIDLEQSNRLEHAESIQIANEHAIVNLMEGDRRLKQASAALQDACRPAVVYPPLNPPGSIFDERVY